MLVFDFDGVLHDSRHRAWRCYQDARREMGLWDLPDLAGPDDLPVVYQGVLSASLTRWIPYRVAEEFWQRHAQLTARTAASDPYGVIPELIGLLTDLARVQGYGILTGSHRSTVETLLHRDIDPAAMPRVLICRETPGSKADKLSTLRAQHGATTYVGDTGSDVLHARKAGLRAVAVTYGYADLDDLTTAAPDYLLTTPADLAAWCQARLQHLPETGAVRPSANRHCATQPARQADIPLRHADLPPAAPGL
ncbi:HAD family hydrolase [Streptomyces sp. NPDC015125]|uniref:HAD family hydrolase n=1 Tax=Streptomyces sp. NPDC015125 TaxID=3364938 RepID=UPI0037032D9C